MAKETKDIYTCTTCGKVSTQKGHLCAPTDKQFTCELCGAESVDPRHICFPKLEKLRYVCGTCGRVAVSSSHLCTPHTIPKAKKGAKSAKRAAGKTSKKKGRK